MPERFAIAYRLPLAYAVVRGESEQNSSLQLRRRSFIVRDANGQALAYVYFEDELGRRAAAKLLTRDEARLIAANVAKPGCLRRSC
jgi:hypothetical protein